MNVRHPMGVLHSFSIKNIFYDKRTYDFFILMWRYVTVYFAKCESEVSQSLKQVAKEIKKKNLHVQEAMKKIAYSFISTWSAVCTRSSIQCLARIVA